MEREESTEGWSSDVGGFPRKDLGQPKAALFSNGPRPSWPHEIHTGYHRQAGCSCSQSGHTISISVFIFQKTSLFPSFQNPFLKGKTHILRCSGLLRWRGRAALLKCLHLHRCWVPPPAPAQRSSPLTLYEPNDSLSAFLDMEMLSQDSQHFCHFRYIDKPSSKKPVLFHTLQSNGREIFSPPKSGTLTTPNAGEDVEQQELSFTAAGNAKQYSHFGRQLGGSYRSNRTLTI